MTLTAATVQLACSACGHSAVVAIDITHIDQTDGKVRVEVAMSSAGLAWIDSHQAPEVVPRSICEES